MFWNFGAIEMKNCMIKIDPLKRILATLLSQPGGKHKCLWVNGSTQLNGSPKPPMACRLHGCLGTFNELPLIDELKCFENHRCETKN